MLSHFTESLRFVMLIKAFQLEQLFQEKHKEELDYEIAKLPVPPVVIIPGGGGFGGGGGFSGGSFGGGMTGGGGASGGW